MIWSIEFLPGAQKDLGELDRKVAARILSTLETRIAATPDPRMHGAPLQGRLAGYWRWRIGDYRVIGTIEEERIRILVVRIGHRRQIYR